MTVKHSNLPNILRVGSRGSPLARAQVDLVTAALQNVAPDLKIEPVFIKTSGDWKPSDGDKALPSGEGGKAQFSKEIEEALLEGAIDCAIHSMKDMEAVLPEGLVVQHMLPREDARDAFLSTSGEELYSLSQGAVIGTVSPRRAAFVKHMRPDIEIVPLRGNVQTRIDKMRSGQFDATLLACAGLNRLGLEHEITEILDASVFVPAGGQGAVGIETRASDEVWATLFDQINCVETVLCVSAEREALRVLGGTCHTAVGMHATLNEGEFVLRGRLVSADGQREYIEQGGDFAEDPISLGRTVGQALKDKIPREDY